MFSTVHTGGLGLTENTEKPVHSDADSTMVGDPELVANPPGDALQELHCGPTRVCCSTSGTTIKDGPSSSGNSVSLMTCPR